MSSDRLKFRDVLACYLMYYAARVMTPAGKRLFVRKMREAFQYAGE